MALLEYTVGPTGTYANLQALESAIDGVAVTGDVVRAVMEDGVHTGTVAFGGWASGVSFEIVADNTGLATIAPVTSGAIIIGGATSPDSILIDGIVLRGHEAVSCNTSIDTTLTVRNCSLDANGFISFDEVIRTKPTAGTLTMAFESCAAFGFGATTARSMRLEFTATATLNTTFKGYTQRGGTLKIYDGGPVSMHGSLLKLDGQLDADASSEWTMVETISNQASPGWNTETDCVFSTTINDSGNPGVGEVSWTDGVNEDLTLVDHANNVALDIWATTPLSTDLTGATRGTPADAGAYEVVAATVTTSNGSATGSTNTSSASASMDIASGAIAEGSTDTSSASAAMDIASSAVVDGSTDTSAASAAMAISSSAIVAGSTNTAAATSFKTTPPTTSSAIVEGSTDTSAASASMAISSSAIVEGSTDTSAASASMAISSSAIVEGSTDTSAASASMAISSSAIVEGSTDTSAASAQHAGDGSLFTSRIGPSGSADYATLQAWDSAIDATTVTGSTYRAEMESGTYSTTTGMGGWASGCFAEIAPLSGVLGDVIINATLTHGGATAPASLKLENIHLQGHEALVIGSSIATTVTLENCFLDGNGLLGFDEVVRVNATGAITLAVNNCVAFGFTDATARSFRLQSTGGVSTTLSGYTQSGGTIATYGDGPLNVEGSLLSVDSLGGDLALEHAMVDTIASVASPSWNSQANCTFSTTFVDGGPAAGQVGFADSTTNDYRLVDDADNIAIDYVTNATLPSLDILGDPRPATPNAGAYETLVRTGSLPVGVSAYTTSFQAVTLTYDTSFYTIPVGVGAYTTALQDVTLTHGLNAPASSSPYGGDRVDGITSIIPSIHASRATGEAPFMLQVTSEGTTATGSLKPFDELYYEWDFGDTDSASIAANAMTNPVTGLAVDPNTDQVGPNASYPYRAAGSYTVTLKVWAANKAGTITAYATTTQAITVSAWSGTDMYFDSVLGNDANSGATSALAKQTYAAMESFLEGGSSRRALIKRGSTITMTSQLRLRNTRQWIGAYGTGAKPRLESDGAGQVNIDGANGGGCLDYVLQDIVIDAMGLRKDPIIFNGNSAEFHPTESTIPAPPNGHWRFLDCDFLNTGATHLGVEGAFVTGSCKDTNDVSFWGCNFDCDEQDGLVLYFYMRPFNEAAAPSEFLSLTGCSFAGGNANVILDHHIYLNGYHKYRTTRWIDHRESTAQSFCQNMNCSDTAGKDTLYTLIEACKMTGTNHGIDLSNGVNDPTLGQFDDTIIQNCDFHIGQYAGSVLGTVLFGFCTRRVTFRDNTGWGNTVSELAVTDPEFEFLCYRNKFWHDRGTSNSNRLPLYAGQTGKFVDNEWQMLGTGSVNIISAPTSVLAAFEWEGNNWRNEESVVLAYDRTLASSISLATWQGTYEATATSVDPGWNDPANGDFSIGAYTVAVGTSTYATTFVDVGLVRPTTSMSVAWNTSKVDYYRESRPFLNLIHYGSTHISRTVSTNTWNDGRAVTADADGYVTALLADQDVAYPMCAGATGGVSGSYVLTFSGDVGLDIDGATNVTEVSQGRWTFDWDGTTGLYLWIQSIVTPATNIKVFYGANETLINAGELFTPEYIAQIDDTSGVRVMEWSRVNNSPLTTTFRAQSHVFWGGSDGVPPAVCVALADRLDCSLWFSVPHQATDAFVTALAPVLDACNGTVYVEYSNETWNGTKSQSSYCTTQGSALAATDRLRNLYFQAKRSIEIWALLNTAGLVAGSKMQRVMASQAADSTRMTDIMFYNSAEALPVTDIISFAPYIGGLTTPGESAAVQLLTNSQYFAAMQADLTTALGWTQDYIDLDLGKQIRLYEAGQHDGVSDSGNDAALDTYLEARQNDPLMGTLYTDYLDGLQAKGVAETYLYNIDQEWTDQYWGALDGGTFGSPSTDYKWAAVQEWIGLPTTAALAITLYAPAVTTSVQTTTSSATASGSTDTSSASAAMAITSGAVVEGSTITAVAAASRIIQDFSSSATVIGSTTIASAAAALAITANGIATGSTSTAAGINVLPEQLSVASVENSMRMAAYAWAGTNGLTFNFDNSTGLDVTNPTQPMLVWAFGETGRERISGDLVTITGEARGTILTPATPIAPGASPHASSPMSDSLALAESLVDTFRNDESLGVDAVTNGAMVSTLGADAVTNGTMDSTFGADAVVDGTFDTGYGFDLVTNGNFGQDITGWTDNSELTGSIAYTSSQIGLTTPIAFSDEGIASQSMTVIIGREYRFTADRSGGNCLIYLGTALLDSTYLNAGNTTNDTIDVIVVPTSTTLVVTLRNYDNIATTALVDNISLREVLSTGSELVTNGTFPTDITSWTDSSIGTGSTLWNATGKLELVNPTGTTANQGASYQTMAVEVGKSYRLEITKSGGNSTVTVGSTSQGNEYLNGSQDLVAVDLVVVATTTLLSVKVRNYNDATNALIDNVTVTELTAGWDQLTVGTSMAGGECQISAASGSDYIRQGGHAPTQGKVVEVTIDVTAHTSGAVRFRFDGDTVLYTMPTSIGTHTMTVVNNGTTGYLYFYNSGVTNITFDNVIVREVIETDWIKSNGVAGYGGTINNGVGRITSDGGDEYLLQTGHGGTQGKVCEITVEITDVTAGRITVGFEEPGVYEILPASVGTHKVLMVNNGPLDRFKINRYGVTDVSFDNVTVKEVLETDWLKSNGAPGYGGIIYGGVCRITSDGGSEYIRQGGHAATQGKSVEVSIDVTALVSGAVRFRFDGDTVIHTMPAATGTHTMTVVNNGTTGLLYFYNSGVTDISFDNVTVKEVIENEWSKNNTFSDSEAIIMGHSTIDIDGAVGTMQAVTAVVEWEVAMEHKLNGTVRALTSTSGVEKSYELFRSIWSTEVEPTITTTTYFDVPPGLEVSLPAAVCSHSILRSSSVEIQSSMGLGRVNIDLHYLLGSGVQDMQVDTDLIVRAFDSVGSGEVVFQTPTVTRLGRTSEETWRVNVRLPFTFKDTFS